MKLSPPAPLRKKMYLPSSLSLLFALSLALPAADAGCVVPAEHRWADNRVLYRVKPPSQPGLTANLEKAMRIWEGKIGHGFRFIDVAAEEAAGFSDQLPVRRYEHQDGRGGSCAKGTERIAKVCRFNFNEMNTLLHELGHSLGLCHEHSCYGVSNQDYVLFAMSATGDVCDAIPQWLDRKCDAAGVVNRAPGGGCVAATPFDSESLMLYGSDNSNARNSKGRCAGKPGHGMLCRGPAACLDAILDSRGTDITRWVPPYTAANRNNRQVEISPGDVAAARVALQGAAPLLRPGALPNTCRRVPVPAASVARVWPGVAADEDARDRSSQRNSENKPRRHGTWPSWAERRGGGGGGGGRQGKPEFVRLNSLSDSSQLLKATAQRQKVEGRPVVRTKSQ